MLIYLYQKDIFFNPLNKVILMKKFSLNPILLFTRNLLIFLANKNFLNLS